MPPIDSIYTNTTDTLDTITALNQQLDTLHDVDSISMQLPETIIRGFQGITHPSLPISENWVFVTLVALFSIMVVAIIHSAIWLPSSFKLFFHTGERRTYLDDNSSKVLTSRLILIFFSAAVFSLYIFTVNFKQYDSFELQIFLSYFVLTLSFLIIKYIIFRFINIIFFSKSSLNTAISIYYNLIIYFGLLIFPLLILKIYSTVNLVNFIDIISLIIGILISIVMIIKLIQIFFHKSIVSFYLLLYLCTLEILPLILLFQAYRAL